MTADCMHAWQAAWTHPRATAEAVSPEGVLAPEHRARRVQELRAAHLVGQAVDDDPHQPCQADSVDSRTYSKIELRESRWILGVAMIPLPSRHRQQSVQHVL